MIRAWFYFYIGHFTSKIDWIDRGWVTGRVYQEAMRRSFESQGDGKGPWRDVEQG